MHAPTNHLLEHPRCPVELKKKPLVSQEGWREVRGRTVLRTFSRCPTRFQRMSAPWSSVSSAVRWLSCRRRERSSSTTAPGAGACSRSGRDEREQHARICHGAGLELCANRRARSAARESSGLRKWDGGGCRSRRRGLHCRLRYVTRGALRQR